MYRDSSTTSSATAASVEQPIDYSGIDRGRLYAELFNYATKCELAKEATRLENIGETPPSEEHWQVQMGVVRTLREQLSRPTKPKQGTSILQDHSTRFPSCVRVREGVIRFISDREFEGDHFDKVYGEGAAQSVVNALRAIDNQMAENERNGTKWLARSIGWGIDLEAIARRQVVDSGRTR